MFGGKNGNVSRLIFRDAALHPENARGSGSKQFDQAQEHFEASLQFNRKMAAPPFVAWSQYEYARMLLRRDGVGDRDRALALAGQALTSAKSMGIERFAERARPPAELGGEERRGPDGDGAPRTRGRRHPPTVSRSAVPFPGALPP